MKLPIKKSVIKYSLENIRMLIYGQPKIGKTTFASGFENALYLDTQQGTKNLEVYSVAIDSWETFLETYEQIIAGKHDFQTIIIDVIDDLYKMCLEYACKKYKMDHPSDEGYGKGWELLRNTFERPILKLAASKYGLVFISHSKEIEITKRYSKITKITTTLSGQAKGSINAIVDIIGYCGFDSYRDGKTNAVKERRVMIFSPSEYLEAGDRTGLLPENIVMSRGNPFKNFKQYFISKED